MTPAEIMKKYPRMLDDIQAVIFVLQSFRMKVENVEFEISDEQPRLKRFVLIRDTCEQDL